MLRSIHRNYDIMASVRQTVRLNRFRGSQCHNRSCLFSTFISKQNDSTDQEYDDEEFKVLNIRKHDPLPLPGLPRRPEDKTFKLINETLPLRWRKMPVDQDWSNVWPAARSFHPATIPLPIRQGYVKPLKGLVPSSKYANAELIKIPNFFHLSPPVVKKHCEALKGFCTPWPRGLETDEDCDRHFPVGIVESDYLHSSPTIRDPKSRIVSLMVKLSSLNVDEHAKDKFLRLVGDRYNEKTDIITIVTDRCPTRKQNYDYAHYLLTVLYKESWKTEDWEAAKTEADHERFFWEKSSHKDRIVELVKKIKSCTPDDGYLHRLSPDPTEAEILEIDEVKNYADKVGEFIDNEEDVQFIDEYKDSVLKLLKLSN